VTTNMNINFMRRPAPAEMVADARILKLGRRLAVGDVTLYSAGDDRPVAHATTTYAIPGG
jgi:acyl-coenzyme A thioesterase PaaI-like protein